MADTQPLRGANLQLRSIRPSQPSYQLRLLHIFSLFTDINPRHITRKGSALPARLVNCFTVAHDSDIDNLMWHNCALKLRWSWQLPPKCPVSGLVAQPGALHSGCSSLAPHSHCKTPMQLGGCSCLGSGLPAKPQVCPVVWGGSAASAAAAERSPRGFHPALGSEIATFKKSISSLSISLR